MLIPVFTVYAPHLRGANPMLIGIALGAYGLSQGLLQMPFGILSDRLGRKTMISLGIILFVAGSLFGALTESIYGMIAARIIQGMGAIGAVLIALMADLTPENQRTRAMAVIGMTIGISFALAMVISPALSQAYGLPGIFYLTALLACLGLVLLTFIPSPKLPTLDEIKRPLLKTVIKNPILQRLNAGIFFQHLILTATFYAIPLALQAQLGRLHSQWHFYLPMMLLAFVIMLPCIYLAEKKHRTRVLFLSSIAITGLAQLLLAFFHGHWSVLCLMMLAYFVAFNILEASLPSLISKKAEAYAKGTAMGVYSSCQFLGIFVGGLMSGMLFQYLGMKGIFLFNALLSLFWLMIFKSSKDSI